MALSPETLLIWLKLDLTEQYGYMLSITFPKLAILCLYERIFTTKLYRLWISLTAAIIVLAWIASAITSFTICRPFKYSWDKTIPGGLLPLYKSPKYIDGRNHDHSTFTRCVEPSNGHRSQGRADGHIYDWLHVSKGINNRVWHMNITNMLGQ